jgi:hypothetical protein
LLSVSSLIWQIINTNNCHILNPEVIIVAKKPVKKEEKKAPAKKK